MNRIEAIVFDYGNVISRFDVQLYFRGILPYSSLSQTDLVLAMRGSSQVIIAYESGEITSDQFFAAMLENCSLKMTRDDFLRVYNGIFEPIQTTQALIRQLHTRYRLGLLSNTSEWHFQHEISRNPVFPLFEAVTVSHEVKARKPAEAIYRDILRKLDLPPAACVYVDDIAEFARAATNLGMHGIHYTSHEELLSSLRKMNVTVPSG